MTKNLYTCLSLFLIIFGSHRLIAQQITVDNSITVQDLIENNLASNCVEISNVTTSLNGSANNFSSFGSFESGNTNFPLSQGIILSTGNAASAGNTVISDDLSEGDLNWGTDPDIDAALGTNNTINATVIEFDFIALSDVIQFNYIFASEEYYANYPCNSSDGFAFLIRESSSTGPYENIAVIPGTNTPVTVNNIHSEILGICDSANEQYFAGYNLANTNFNGSTTVLTAASNVTPNVQYHVKLIVADQANDPGYDSAVFIESATFNDLELGDDINTCSSSVTLNGEIQNPLATYAWYRDNMLIAGETNPTLTTTESGLYRVEITISGVSCVITDEITVTIDTELTTNPIPPYTLCDANGDGQETFNLLTKNSDVAYAIPALPTNYTIAYYNTENDARNNPDNNITSLTTGSTTVYVRVEDTDAGCLFFGTIDLVVNPLPNVTQPDVWDICDNDNVPDNRTEIDLREQDATITNSQTNLSVSYHYSQSDADNDFSPIISPYINTNPNETLYVRVEDTQTGCANTSATLTLNVTNGNTQILRDRQYLDACDQDHDGFATFDLTEVISRILNGENGFNSPTYHTTQEDAESGSNAIQNPTSFQNTIANEQTIYIRLEDSSTGCYAIIPLEIHTNLLLTATDTNEFALCDEAGSNGVIGFDLYAVENYVIGEIPTLYFPIEVSFYETQNDLDNDNALDKNVLYNVSASQPSTLFIKIVNTDTGCTEEEDIILRVNPILLFTTPDPLPYCDDDSDGMADVYLHDFDAQILNGNSDFTVSYFATEDDATQNLSQLPNPYLVDQQTTVWARITNTNTGCHTENAFDIAVVVAPATTRPNDIVICDDDQDGFSIVNLDATIDELVADPTGLTISFHSSLANAEANIAPITNSSAYDANSQTVYARVADASATTTCPSIQSINIIINTLPVIPTISTYQICVDQGTTSADFIFSNKDAEILNGQTGKEVYYFEDSNYTTPIDKYAPYSSNGAQTIYVRVENISDASCNSIASFSLEVSHYPTYNTNFSDFPPVCQSIANDYTFNFEEKRQEIAQGSTDNLNIQFFLNESDAVNNTGTPLPDQFTYIFNDLNRQGQFYARIENAGNSCALVETIRYITFPTPHIISATVAPVCDTDYDGSTTIDLSTTAFNIENVRFGETTISYYEDEDLLVEIPTSTITDYQITTSKTIYVKAEIEATSCYDYIAMDLQVNLPPAVNTIDPIVFCDNDTNTYDLSQVNTMLVDNTNNITITYHNSQTDAENGTSPISTNYTYNTSNPTIYARIANSTTGCFVTQAFQLQINPNPVANTPQDFEACDDDFDGFLEFNLRDNDTNILGPQSASEYTITYYNSITNAMNAVNPLGDIHAAVDGEIVYARIENNLTECYAFTQFNIYVNPLPIIPVQDVEPLCLNDLPQTVSAETGNAGDTYLWDTGDTTPEIELGIADIGAHWVEVTTLDGCSYRKDFNLIESEEADINFTTKVDFADPNSITVDVSGIGNYVYILDNGEPQTANVFNNVSFGLHQITIRDLNGCEDVITEVFVFDIPKFFTPNNDGTFDTWHVIGIEQLPGTLVYIYDRYGKLLKTLTHNSLGWDGTFNGENMPSNDYWFVAKIIQNGNPFEVKGHFALKR
ncbi:T9SS type B sorting domain-containing protein [Aestuariibaculum suncheonense]|uniref:T9SS type B sorting domain-containing protein n=1 Tax=Aestuariibaculum suncheonense TaxID=1028745 RepID=A0A8J6QRS6_9FLAO|nr:choice-of-anchor L domain-containing protein [Aestuariibaculum suncheonense]MBD0834909.1 T9SS type B sorting domain-containing protein [Aestuariibaculum suncheonense]